MRSSLIRRVPIPARLLVTLGVPLLALVGVLGAQVQQAREDGARARLGVEQAGMLTAMARLQASVTQPETLANGMTVDVLKPDDIGGRLLIGQMTGVINGETTAAMRGMTSALKQYPGVLSAAGRDAVLAELAALRPVMAGDAGPARLSALTRARTAADDALTDTYLSGSNDVPWLVFQGVIELNRTTLAEFSAVITTLAGNGRITAAQLSALSGQRANAVNRSRYGVDAKTRHTIDKVLASESYRRYVAAGERAVAVASGRARPESALSLAPVGINAITLRHEMDAISAGVMQALTDELIRRAAEADAEQREAFWIAGIVVLVTLALAVGALRSITVPLRRITTRAGELAAGRLDGEPVPVVGSDELARLTVALEGAASTLLHVNAQAEAMAEGRLDDPSLARPAPGPLGEVLHENVSAVQASASRLRHAADHDGLTGLLNRAGLENQLDTTRGHWLLYLDLDGFKQVNDIHGHDQGDNVLRAVAERLLRALGPGDLVCRLGGDEFVAVLHGSEPLPLGPGEEMRDPDDLGSVGDLQEAESAQARIEAAIRRPIRIRAAEATAAGGDLVVDHVQVGVSVGRARVAAGGSLDVALAEADAGMYRVKRDGKARRAERLEIGPAFGVPSPAGERGL